MVEGYKNTEVGIIPNDWAESDIAQIIGETNGIKIGPFGSQLKKDLLTNSGIKVYGQENVFNKNMEVGHRYISKEHFHKLSSCEIKSKDFLISMMGTIGKCMIIPDKFEAGIMDSHLIRLRLNQEKCNPELLLHFFSSNILINQVKKLSVGGIMDGLSSKLVKQIKIPLPPTLTEQTAIATALNDSDELIASLEKLIAKKKAIKQGAMQELLKPKEGWETKFLGDITNIRRGASPRPIKDTKWFSQKGRGWIRISDVTCSNVYLNSTSQYLSEEGVKFSVPVDKGDLIMSICATIGVPIIVNFPACIHDGFVLFSSYGDHLDTSFLYFFLKKHTEILSEKGQPGAQKNLNIFIVENIEISYPNIEKQKQIGIALMNMELELSGIERKLEKQKQLKQGMMQSLLTGKIRLV